METEKIIVPQIKDYDNWQEYIVIPSYIFNELHNVLRMTNNIYNAASQETAYNRSFTKVYDHVNQIKDADKTTLSSIKVVGEETVECGVCWGGGEIDINEDMETIPCHNCKGLGRLPKIDVTVPTPPLQVEITKEEILERAKQNVADRNEYVNWLHVLSGIDNMELMADMVISQTIDEFLRLSGGEK